MDLSNVFAIRTAYFILSFWLEIHLFKYGQGRYSWLGRVLRLAGLIITVGLLILQEPHITTLDDFFSVLLAPAIIGVTFAIGFGHLRDWYDHEKVQELDKQYQPLVQRSDFNDG